MDSASLMLGSVEEIVEQCHRLHGLGVASIATFGNRGGLDLAPVIDALRR